MALLAQNREMSRKIEWMNHCGNTVENSLKKLDSVGISDLELLSILQEISKSEIPRIVALGGQGVGKSTLLNRLMGQEVLPQRKPGEKVGSDTKTKCALELSQYPDIQKKISARLTGSWDSPVRDYHNTYTDLKVALMELHQWLDDANERAPKREKSKISDFKIVIEVWGPKFKVPLTLHDLPGILYVPGDMSNLHSKELALQQVNAEVNHLVFVLDKPNISAAGAGVAEILEGALNLGVGHRTSVVLTHADGWIDPQSHNVESAQNSLGGKDVVFGLRPYAVVTTKSTDEDEDKWFADNSQLIDPKGKFSSQFGVRCLREQLAKKLHDKVNDNLDPVRNHMREARRIVNRLLNDRFRNVDPVQLCYSKISAFVKCLSVWFGEDTESKRDTSGHYNDEHKQVRKVLQDLLRVSTEKELEDKLAGLWHTRFNVMKRSFEAELEKVSQKQFVKMMRVELTPYWHLQNANNALTSDPSPDTILSALDRVSEVFIQKVSDNLVDEYLKNIRVDVTKIADKLFTKGEGFPPAFVEEIRRRLFDDLPEFKSHWARLRKSLMDRRNDFYHVFLSYGTRSFRDFWDKLRNKANDAKNESALYNEIAARYFEFWTDLKHLVEKLVSDISAKDVNGFDLADAVIHRHIKEFRERSLRRSKIAFNDATFQENLAGDSSFVWQDRVAVLDEAKKVDSLSKANALLNMVDRRREAFILWKHTASLLISKNATDVIFLPGTLEKTLNWMWNHWQNNIVRSWCDAFPATVDLFLRQRALYEKAIKASLGDQSLIKVAIPRALELHQSLFEGELALLRSSIFKDNLELHMLSLLGENNELVTFMKDDPVAEQQRQCLREIQELLRIEIDNFPG